MAGKYAGLTPVRESMGLPAVDPAAIAQSRGRKKAQRLAVARASSKRGNDGASVNPDQQDRDRAWKDRARDRADRAEPGWQSPGEEQRAQKKAKNRRLPDRAGGGRYRDGVDQDSWANV